ncbi:hypothetical protein MJH12_00195 [bacterium]|nr:hypothetical protein [bacterium]
MKSRVFIALFLFLAIYFQSLLLNYRQTHHIFKSRTVIHLLQKEFQVFFSSLFWNKVDTYGHFGDWKEEIQPDGQVKYFTSIERQKDVDAMGEISVALDPSFTERVALIASELALKRDDVSKARAILFRSIVYYPDQMKLYRLYGELGHIYYFKYNNYDKALRFFEKSRQFLKRVDPKSYNFEDTFHIRLYGLSAGLSAFKLRKYDLAFQFYRMSGYESGTKEYDLKMEQIAFYYGEFKSLRKERAKTKRRKKAEKKFIDHKDHKHEEEGHEGHGHEGHDHGEEIHEKKEVSSVEIALYNKKIKDQFLSLVPKINERIYSAISYQTANYLYLAIFLMIFFYSLYRVQQSNRST